MESEKDTQISTALERPARFSQQIAEHLRREITEGFYQAGEKLPSEASLCKRFGISRTVIREALAGLQYEGLLLAEQGRGVIVMQPEKKTSFRFGSASNSSDDDYAHIYDMRAVLEIEAAVWAAIRRTPDELSDLKYFLDQMVEAAKKNKDGTEAHRGFNLTLFRMTKNKYLYDFITYLIGHIDRQMRLDRKRLTASPGMPQIVLQEHVAIYDALVAGDPVAARKAATEHLQRSSYRKGLMASAYFNRPKAQKKAETV